MALDPITAGLGLADTLIRRWFPDPAEAAKHKAEVLQMHLAGELTKFQTAGEIIKAEAASEHALTATWRPIVMLTFTGLVVAHFLGFTAPGIDADQVQALLEIVQYGLTGYILGRSAEKGIKAWKQPD